MNKAERALINECRRRVQELKDDPDVTTVDGRNYRAQRVTRALDSQCDGAGRPPSPRNIIGEQTAGRTYP